MDRGSSKVNICGWSVVSTMTASRQRAGGHQKKKINKKCRHTKTQTHSASKILEYHEWRPRSNPLFFFFLKSERHPCRPEANCSSAARLISSICFLQPSLRNGGCLPWPALSTKQQATRYRAAHPCGGEIPIMVHLVCSMPSGEKPDFSIFIRGFFKLPYFQTLWAQIYGSRGP